MSAKDDNTAQTATANSGSVQRVVRSRTRTYTIVCPSCLGRGVLDSPWPMTTTQYVTCPACQGSQVVVVTETDEGS